MVKEPGKAARVYSVNQEKLDEALQASMDFILEVASEEKLTDIKKQLDARLKANTGGK